MTFSFFGLYLVETATIAHRALDEVLLLCAVLAVPVSYLIGVAAHHCCPGSDGGASQQDHANLEMAKMDKIYQEVRCF